eukprot:scaffold1034_cov127-Cylindrotheca_fusiformis.AAC.41
MDGILPAVVWPAKVAPVVLPIANRRAEGRYSGFQSFPNDVSRQSESDSYPRHRGIRASSGDRS